MLPPLYVVVAARRGCRSRGAPVSHGGIAEMQRSRRRAGYLTCRETKSVYRWASLAAKNRFVLRLTRHAEGELGIGCFPPGAVAGGAASQAGASATKCLAAVVGIVCPALRVDLVCSVRQAAYASVSPVCPRCAGITSAPQIPETKGK